MWNTQFGKAVRWTFFLPLLVLAVGLISFLFIYLTSVGIEMLSSWWEIVLVIVFAGFAWTFFDFISIFLTSFVLYVCPNKQVGVYSLSIVATTNFGLMLYSIWAQDSYPTKVIILSVVVSILVLKLWFSLVFASFYSHKNYLNEL